MYQLTSHLQSQNTCYKIKTLKQVIYWIISASSLCLWRRKQVTEHHPRAPTCSQEAHIQIHKTICGYFMSLSRLQKYFALAVETEHILIALLEQEPSALSQRISTLA